jgi:transcriptional regulator with XRE-family HTH domain
MTGDELIAWRKMVKLSQQQAADVHGYGRRHYRSMERGVAEIRAGVDLACAAYALGIRDYDGPSLQAQMEQNTRKGRR